MFGVMLAGIKHYYKAFYERFSGAYLFWMSVVITLFIVLYYVIVLEGGGEPINYSIIARTVLFDIISFAFMLMIWSVEKSKRINNLNGILRKIFTVIAVTSYSVYLIHLEIFSFVISKTESIHSIPMMFVVLFLTLALVYILAYGLYYYWEKPFMNLRDKIRKMPVGDLLRNTSKM